MRYEEFLQGKTQFGENSGFDPVWMPDFLFPFQANLVEHALRKGRSALYEDCGLGKTPQQLVWAENVLRHTGKPVLILTPLAVSGQTVSEGEKFGIEVKRSSDGQHGPGITVTNYERLQYFNRHDFTAVVCDESSILKNFDGVTKCAVTEFMRKMPYRLLCTATAAPNDYIELGTSSEALGYLGFVDMVAKFFKKTEKTSSRKDELRGENYRFRGHAERDFWRWVCSWARAARKPSDLGFDDNGFILPELRTVEHVIQAKTKRPGWLIDMEAQTLQEQREERRRTIQERCECAASLVAGRKDQSISWVSLCDEGKLLEQLIPNSVEVDGQDCDEYREEIFTAFSRGEVQNLISKTSICGFGMNWQNCCHQTYFPSHSFEQWYQGIRRSWRYGQKNPVTIDMVTSEGEAGVLKNLNRKAAQAEVMFSRLVELMNNELNIERVIREPSKVEIPAWL